MKVRKVPHFFVVLFGNVKKMCYLCGRKQTTNKIKYEKVENELTCGCIQE